MWSGAKKIIFQKGYKDDEYYLHYSISIEMKNRRLYNEDLH